MSLERSPSLETFKDGMPKKLPDQKAHRKWRRGIIAALALIALALGLYNFLQTDTAAVIAGTGAVTGTVVDENGQPVAAQIYILGSKVRGQAQADGTFHIEDVSSGVQSIAVAYQGSGFESPAFVVAGETTDLGELKFTSTLEPQP